MGKDVIIILIIILSYKILMKYTRNIEGLDDKSSENSDSIILDIFNSTTKSLDNIMQQFSDNTLPYICQITSKDYDSINRECVTFDPSSRPEMCKPENEVNCKHTYYNSSVDCDTFTNETECNDNINCKYDLFSEKCKDNPNLCKFKENICRNKNFSVDLSVIKIIINLYKENSLEDIKLEDFLSNNNYITDLNINDDEVMNMITYYNNTNQINHVESVSSFIEAEFSSQMNNLIKDTNVNDIISQTITNLNSDTTNVISLNRLVSELYSKLNSIDPFSDIQDRNNDQLLLDNSRIYLNVLIIILYLYFYYDKRKETGGMLSDNACLKEKNGNESICQIDDNNKCIDNDRVTSIICKNKIGSECLTDPKCEIQAGWTICEPGKKLIDNSCVDLPNEEYSGTYNKNGDLITKDDLNSYQSRTDEKNILSTDNVQKCYMGEDFSKKNANQIDILNEIREKPQFNRTKLNDSTSDIFSELPRKNVNIFGTVPNNSEDYKDYYKNSMCISCFDNDIINDINKSFRKDNPGSSEFTEGELCGVKGYFRKSIGDQNYSECNKKKDKISCNTNSHCEWTDFNDLLINTGNDEHDGICLNKCPKIYYSENDGECIKTSDNSFPVQTSSLYKKCKNLGEVQCDEDRDCTYYDDIDKCFPNSLDESQTLVETLNNHIYSLYDMLGTGDSSFTYDLLNPTEKSGFTDNGVILDNFDIPIMDDEVPCWYLGKIYDYSSKTCKECPNNTIFRAKDDYSDGECVNELTYDELLHTVDDTLSVYKNYPDTSLRDISIDNFLDNYYVNKAACTKTSKSKDGISEWSVGDSQLGKNWYKPNCNFEGEPKDCILTDVSNSDGVQDCLSRIGCKIIGEPDNYTCVPTEDNNVDLTLKDIGYEYFKLLNPNSENNIKDFIHSFSNHNFSFSDGSEQKTKITNRKELCEYNGSHGTCQTCYDEETMIDNTRTEDGKGCKETCEPNKGSNIDKTTNFNVPYKSVTNKCSSWGDNYDKNMNKYWPSVKLSDNKVSLDIINDPNAEGSDEKNYILFMDIKTNFAFIDLIRQFERQYLPHVIFNNEDDTKTEFEKEINKKAYIAQNKKVRIPWQQKDGRILKVGITTPLPSDNNNAFQNQNIQINKDLDNIELNKYFNNSTYPDEKYYYTPITPLPRETINVSTQGGVDQCMEICNQDEDCDAFSIDNNTTCNTYNNVESSMIRNYTRSRYQNQYYMKDYPTISKTIVNNPSNLNTGEYLSGLDFFSDGLCGYTYYYQTPNTNEINIDGYLDQNPFNFYTKIRISNSLNTVVDYKLTGYTNQITYINTSDECVSTNGSEKGGVSGYDPITSSSYYFDTMKKTDSDKLFYIITPQKSLSDDSMDNYRYYYPKKLRNMYYKSEQEDPSTHELYDRNTGSINFNDANIFLFPEIDILYYLDKTNKDTLDTNIDEYGLPIGESFSNANKESLKDIKYIDRRRLTNNSDDFIYPLLNNVISYDDSELSDSYTIDDNSNSNIFNFISDSVITTDIKNLDVRRLESSTADNSLNIMTERFINLNIEINPDITEPPVENIQITSIKKEYIKNRTIFDMLLNYSPLSGLPGVSNIQDNIEGRSRINNSETEPSHFSLYTPNCIQLYNIYSSISKQGSLDINAKYNRSLGIYFTNYLLMKHILQYDNNNSPYWNINDSPELSTIKEDFENVLKLESNDLGNAAVDDPDADADATAAAADGDADGDAADTSDGADATAADPKSFFIYNKDDIIDMVTDPRNPSSYIEWFNESLENVITWISLVQGTNINFGNNQQRPNITLWETISNFIIFYGFLDFLIGDRAEEILDEIIIQKCVNIPCGDEEKLPYIRKEAQNKEIKYYVDQLIDYTYEMLSEYLETCVYIGDKNRLNISESNTNVCKKKGDNIVGCDKHFYQIIPYRKEKIYTNRSFIEIMKENTINEENGLTLSIFMNDYINDIFKDFRNTDILNRYTPLRYPIPETIEEKTFTINSGNTLLVGLKVEFSDDSLSNNNVFSQLLLGVKLPTQNKDVTINYSQLVDLFRSGNILNYTESYRDQFKKSFVFLNSDGETGAYYNDKSKVQTQCDNMYYEDNRESNNGDYIWNGQPKSFLHTYILIDDEDNRNYPLSLPSPGSNACGNNVAYKLNTLTRGGVTTQLASQYQNKTYGTLNDMITNIIDNYNQINTIIIDKLKKSKYIAENGDILFEDENETSTDKGLKDIISLYTQVNNNYINEDGEDQYILANNEISKSGNIQIVGSNIYVSNIKISMFETQETEIINYGLYNTIPRSTQSGTSPQRVRNQDYLTSTITLDDKQEDFESIAESGTDYTIFYPESNSIDGKLEKRLTLRSIQSPEEDDSTNDDSSNDDSSNDDYYTKTSILNKMIEICNTPNDNTPSNSDENPINSSKNTGLLQAFFDDNTFNTLTDKGKYFSNITKGDIECVKLEDLYGDLKEDISDYCQIIDPQCENVNNDKCNFKTINTSDIKYRGKSEDEQSKYYIFTSLENISNKVNNLVYNIYDYISESSYSESGLDSMDDNINEYCKESCQRIIPDTTNTNYINEDGEDLGVPLPYFRISKKPYTTYNNNELTYINYTDGLYNIDEQTLNSYKNYDISENIFTNIYSYNSEKCMDIDNCDVDNIKVFDIQHKGETEEDYININELEHFDRVWPQTTTISDQTEGSSSYDPKDIYKCSRYCAINETCESIPDDGLLRYITDDSLDSNEYNDPLGRANPKFDNIFSQTNMANINPGYCPPFTKSVDDGKCVYYTDDGKVYDYNGEEEDIHTPSLFGVTSVEHTTNTVSEECHLQPKTFQDNIELFHACEKWYLKSTNDPDNPNQNNLDKCIGDISQSGSIMNSEKYLMPNLNLESENNKDSIFNNRTKINNRFSNTHEIESCKINDNSELNDKTCVNFVTDYIVRENYYKNNNKEHEGLQKLNEYHIGPRSHNGEYFENNPIHNSKIGINPPSPLEPYLGDSYINKDFFGKYEYAKYVNPYNLFGSSSISNQDIIEYKTEKLDPMYEQSDNSPDDNSLYSNINRYSNGGECNPTDEGSKIWPFLGFS